jgi:hypothetical protein
MPLPATQAHDVWHWGEKPLPTLRLQPGEACRELTQLGVGVSRGHRVRSPA